MSAPTVVGFSQTSFIGIIGNKDRPGLLIPGVHNRRMTERGKRHCNHVTSLKKISVRILIKAQEWGIIYCYFVTRGTNPGHSKAKGEDAMMHALMHIYIILINLL